MKLRILRMRKKDKGNVTEVSHILKWGGNVMTSSISMAIIKPY